VIVIGGGDTGSGAWALQTRQRANSVKQFGDDAAACGYTAHMPWPTYPMVLELQAATRKAPNVLGSYRGEF